MLASSEFIARTYTEFRSLELTRYCLNVAYFEDDDEQTDDWSDTTTIEAASVKDLAYLKRDVDELRRGLRTVWVLCIFALASLVVSLAFLAYRPIGLSQDDLKEVLRNDKVDQVLHLLEDR